MNEFWTGKRVLVTGHTGFKGSWLTAWLHRLGATVTGFALDPPSTPSLFDLGRIGELCQDDRGDIRDSVALNASFARAEPEVVFHLAAQPLVRASYEAPAETFDVNVVGTSRVLDAIRVTPSVRAAVIVTSDKCYRNDNAGSRFAEADTLGGSDPYSASKACSELVVTSYKSSYFSTRALGIATARAGNVIGGGDFAEDRLLPDILRAFANRAPVQIRNPNATRPFQHVLDPLHGYLVLARYLSEQGSTALPAFNFGPLSERSWTVEEMVRHAAACWGDDARWQTDGRQHPKEAALLALDSSLAAKTLGVTARLDTATAVAATVEFHRRLADGASARTRMDFDFSSFEAARA